MTSAFEYFVEIAEAGESRLSVEAIAEQTMKEKAAQLFQDIMTGMAEATLREMDSVPDDWYSPCGYDREATSADWEHMRDYGHTWGPGCEEPTPTREETLAGFAASNAKQHKELLPFIEKALQNNVPESRVRDILSIDFCGDFELTTDEIKERIEKSIVRAGNEKKWTPVEDGPVTLRDNNGVWLYLDEKYQDQYENENGIIDIRAELYNRYKEDVDNGFGIFETYEEFIKSTYLESPCMYALMLTEPDLIEAYRFDLQIMAMELADWHLLEKNGNQTLWYLFASDNEPWLPFKVDKTSLSESDKQNGFTVRFNTHEELQEYLENIIITDPEKEEMFNKTVYPRIGFETPKRKGR